MGNRKMGDSSRALAEGDYPAIDAWGFYIGGDTPHVWTDAEVEVLKRKFRYLLPIFTNNHPQSWQQGQNDGMIAVAWMHAHSVPAASAVGLDYEDAQNAQYLQGFEAAVLAYGYKTLLYGQTSTVYGNPRPSAGYWGANWNGIPHLNPKDCATQYISDTMLGEPYDLSLLSDSLVLWDTIPPAPHPAPVVRRNKAMYLISVTPDPTQPGTTNTTGIFGVHEGLGPVHVDGKTYANPDFVADHGPVRAVDPQYYQNLIDARDMFIKQLAASIPVTVTGSGTLEIG